MAVVIQWVTLVASLAELMLEDHLGLLQHWVRSGPNVEVVVKREQRKHSLSTAMTACPGS